MFAGGLAWFVLGLVLLCGLFAFVELNVADARLVASVVPIVEAQNASDTNFNISPIIFPADGFELFSSPALMSYGLAALVLLWAMHHHYHQKV